jgi:putative thioredoxin
MIDVTVQNFETEVIAASMLTPVLVDFWAPWCGPCKTLSPVLEQLETEYQGRFKLVKIDSDQEQQLAAAFGIRSIPTCILLKNGQPVDGFAGALPAGQLRQFLDKHVPSEGALVAESEVSEAEALLESGDTQAALAKLADALAQDPANDDARADYVRLLVATGAYEEAAAALDEPLARIPRPLRFDALRRWLDAMEFVEKDDRGNWPIPQFDDLIAQNKRDFDTRFAKAQVLMAEGQWTQAMDELLEIVMRDKKWNDELARKTFVAILELLTPPPTKAAAADGKSAGGIELTGKAAKQEDPQAALLSSYRRKLSMALN